MSVQLGAMHSASFATDPKHLGFVLARYHFAARMLAGLHSVLEVGCGDGTGAQIVRGSVHYLALIDADPNSVGERHDMVDDGPYDLMPWDAVYALDVLEHIVPADEDVFLGNIVRTLKPHGCVIIGTPSLESQPYASELSRLYHVNCKTEDGLRETLQRHFHNVFLFGMNDATLHTGFGAMCHYRLAVCAGKR